MDNYNEAYNNYNAQESPEMAQLNANIAAEEENIQNVYTQLGRLYFNRHADDSEECFIPMINAVKATKEKIEGYRKEILLLKGLMLCPNCGGEIPANSVFCNLCGTPLTDDAPKPETEVCRHCGFEMPAGMRFCSNCGKSMADEPEPVEPEIPETFVEPEVPEIPVEPEIPEIPEIPVEPEIPESPVEPEQTVSVARTVTYGTPENSNEIFSNSAETAVNPVKKCPVCGYESYDEEMNFCEECGTKLVSADSVPVYNAQKVCPNCGAPADGPDSAFCIRCGTRL